MISPQQTKEANSVAFESFPSYVLHTDESIQCRNNTLENRLFYADT